MESAPQYYCSLAQSMRGLASEAIHRRTRLDIRLWEAAAGRIQLDPDAVRTHALLRALPRHAALLGGDRV